MIARVKLENGFSVLWPKSGTSSFSVAIRIQSTYLFLEAKQSLQQGQMLQNGEESGNCWPGLPSAGMQPGTHPGKEPGSLPRPHSPGWKKAIITPRSVNTPVCRHAAAGGGCNPRRQAVRRPATLGLLSETRSRVAGTKAGNKGKIIFLSAICSGKLCGSPCTSLPRLTAAESFERCCSPVENDIRPCQAFGAVLGSVRDPAETLLPAGIKEEHLNEGCTSTSFRLVKAHAMIFLFQAEIEFGLKGARNGAFKKHLRVVFVLQGTDRQSRSHTAQSPLEHQQL